jgi:tetratricopeptide (TPR) repeat protein
MPGALIALRLAALFVPYCVSGHCVYATLGDQSTAVERARQAIRRRPGYAPAHYILAIALGHRGELDEARTALAKCDELSPGFVQSRRDWQPYADPASNERLHEGLRRIEE